MEGLDLIKAVWLAQPGKYVCVSTRNTNLLKGDPNRWQDHMFDDVDKALAFVKRKADQQGIDLYFAPMKFKERRRDKKQVAPVKYLWQDLDQCDPSKIPASLFPTIAWESSPGRFHALWELEDLVDLGRQQPVNRALAYKLAPMGADKGGWDATQVLRIPGTRNWKYKDGPVVELLGTNGPRRSLTVVANILDVTPSDQPEKAAEGVSGAKGLTFEGVLGKHRGQISRKVLSVLVASEAPEGKRSDTLWWLGHELMKAGLSTAEIYVLLKGSVWNKYAGRSDEEERLTHEIARAFEDEVLDGDSSRGSSGGKRTASGDSSEAEDRDGDDENATSLTILSDEELMGSLDTYPGWLVDGIWTRRSHGIVAGEPKSFKSTLLTDLAVSVASGLPFLGKFEVHEQGSVLIIQNENANWIMVDRLAKVRAGKDLMGSFDKRTLEVTWAPQLPIHYINQQGFSITDPLHKKILEKTIDMLKPVLIILDPLYLMFDGDLNQAKDLNPALQWLLKIKQRFNTAVILVHHNRKGQTSSRGGQNMLGSTTLHGWIESAWYLRVGGSDSDDSSEDEESAEGEEREVVNKTAAEAEITMEREFRGAGMYPKIDITLKMGGFGEAKYAAEVHKHVPQETKDSDKKAEKKAAKLSDLKRDIYNTLIGSHERLSIKRLSESSGESQRMVKKALEELAADGRAKLEGVGVKGGWRPIKQ